jgi:hypothetical protein
VVFLKGFFFSLDSLIASSIMLAAVAFALSQPVENRQNLDDYRLDKVHLANIQSTSDWNSTYNTSDSVSKTVMVNFYNGSRSRAEKICSQYFSVEDKYGVFTSNSTSNSKICGNINVQTEDSLVSGTSVSPMFYVNGTVLGPREMTMVIRD